MSLEIQGDVEITIGGQATTVELRQTQKTIVTMTAANPLKK